MKIANVTNLPDSEKVEGFRRIAEDLRTERLENPWRNFRTAKELADMADDYAGAIEAGKIVDGEIVEEVDLERLRTEAETARRVIDLSRRHDAGSLAELNERFSKEDKK
jgi:hypothetical protein